MKIVCIALVVFGLAGMFASSAQASATSGNFFETSSDRVASAVNQFAANISFAKADLSSFFGQVKCFFGFGCETQNNGAVKTESKPIVPEVQNNVSQTEVNSVSNAPVQNEIAQTTQQAAPAKNSSQIENIPTPPAQITQIIQPTKEIQTIHTVTNNTNTVVVDEDTKAKVNLLLRQLDSDRPSFSLGQSFSMPSNLSGKTLNIGSNGFTVDAGGNVNAQTITTAGDFIVQGNFTVSGTQTFSGTSALNASTATPLFAIDQGGSGVALRADNLTLKNSTISTNSADSAMLLDPNGTGAVQFHSTGNYIDSTGNLVLLGGITAASLNTGAGAIQTTGAISGSTFNGLTINPSTGTLAIANGKTLTLGDNATLSGTNTGDQTITLTGAVIGTGTGSFATTLTGAGLDNIFSSNGLLKRTGANTYTIDANNYLTSYTETDPIFFAWNKSTGILIPASQVSDFATAVSANSDVIHGATAYGWGNHSLAGYLTALSSLDPSKVSQTASYRFVTDAEKSTWGGKQDASANLTGVAGLSYLSGAPFVKMTGTNTFALDTNTYLTSLSGAMLATGETTGATAQAQTFTNGIISNATSTFAGNISITGNIVPTAFETYSLGSAANPWKDLYVGHASIYVNGQKVLQTDAANSVVVSADATQNLILKTTEGGDVELNPAAGVTQGQIRLKGNIVLTGTKTFGTSDSSAVIFPNGVSTPSITTTVLNGGIAITPNGIGNTYVTAGNFGVGMTAPTARLQLAAGSATANTAPLKFTSGSLLGTPEAGAMEFLNDAYYGTITTGGARKQFAFTDSSITGAAAGLAGAYIDWNAGSGGASILNKPTLGAMAAGAFPTSGFVVSNGSGWNSSITDNSANWNTAYGWGNWAHTTLVGYGITDALGLHGTADAATKLANARNINGISFDGTGNITIAADANTLTGTTLNSTILASSLTSVGTLANLTVTNPISGSLTGSSGSTTGNAAGLSGQYINWNSSSGGPSIANKPTLGAMSSGAYPTSGIVVSNGSGWGSPITDNSANWNTAYSQTFQWNGGATNLVAATGRTSLGLGTIATQAETAYALLAGRAGGQTLIGGSGATDILKLQGTSGSGTLTSAGLQALVGSNGGTVAMTILNNGAIGINNGAPGRKLDITETTSATPQLKLTYDSNNFGEMYVNSVGDMFVNLNQGGSVSGGQNMTLLNQNLKVCTGGTFGSNTCPTTGFNIAGTGNLVVANWVAATDYQKICATGYVWVPGSAKYGTMPGFCVMKYEAKCTGSLAGTDCNTSTDVPVSQPANSPWRSNISQENARLACQRVGLGYHLISEAEWMTIADNAAVTPINDLSATAGLQIANGHSDNYMTYSNNTGNHTAAMDTTILTDSTKSWAVNQWKNMYAYNTTTGQNCYIASSAATTVTCSGAITGNWNTNDVYRIIGPLPALAAADPIVTGCNLNLPMSDAANAYVAGSCEIRGNSSYSEGATDKGYYGTGNNYGQAYSSGGQNNSQLRTLVLSNGNVLWDFSGNVWKWTDSIIIGQEEPEDATPADEWLEFNAVTKWKGINYAMPSYSGWTASNGIGRIYTQVGTAGTGRRAFLRSGYWNNGDYDGPFTLYLGVAPSGTDYSFGFRCAR